MTRQQLETLSREALIAQARSLGVTRPDVLTKPELVAAIGDRAPSSSTEKKPRGLLGRLRDMVATMVERGLDLPQTADRIRHPAPAPPASPAPLATVTLAEIYAAQGHTDRALAVLDDVLGREPDHAAAKALRARLVAAPPTTPRPVASDDGEGEGEGEGAPGGGAPIPMGSNPSRQPAAPSLSVGPEASSPGASPAAGAPSPAPAPAPSPAQSAASAAPGREGEPARASAPPQPLPDVPRAPGAMPDEEPLPASYDVDEVVVMPVTPTTVYLYWEVRASTIVRCRATAPQGRLVICVEAEDAPGEPPLVREIWPEALVGDYFFHGVPSGSTVQAMVAWQVGERLDEIARSLPMLNPRALPDAASASAVVSWRPDGPRKAGASQGIALAVALSDASAGVMPPLALEPAVEAGGVEGPSDIAVIAPSVAIPLPTLGRPFRRGRRVFGGSSEQWGEEGDDLNEEGGPDEGAHTQGGLGGSSEALVGQIGGSERRLGERGGSERRLGALGGSERRLGGSEARLGSSERRLGGSEERLGSSERRLGGSEARLGGSEARLGGSEARLGGSEGRLGAASGARQRARAQGPTQATPARQAGPQPGQGGVAAGPRVAGAGRVEPGPGAHVADARQGGQPAPEPRQADRPVPEQTSGNGSSPQPLIADSGWRRAHRSLLKRTAAVAPEAAASVAPEAAAAGAAKEASEIVDKPRN